MINTVTLVGRITKDPELQKVSGDISLVKFTLAVNRIFNRDETDFIRIVAWRNSADFVGRYVKKGVLLGVVGRIETGSYEGKNGDIIYTTEVVADNIQSLESKKEVEARQQDGGYQQEQYNDESEETFSGPTLDISSDDLPF